MENAIQWFYDHEGKVTYSMNDRRGPNSYDCSSSEYYSLIAGGIFPVGIYIGNTDSLFADLEKHGWQQVQADANGNFPTVRGDVFIWGTRGDSTGAGGHTGTFVDNNNVIHCSYAYNGIHVNNYDNLHQANGFPTATYYHYVGTPTPQVEAVDQVINPGSWIEFPGSYTADDVQDVADVWQAQSNELCTTGFTWADNGIPCAPLVVVDADGYATNSQVLDVGSKFVIPGKYQVLDVGQSGDRWLGQIEMAGEKLWVDLAPVTEVGPNDGGTPIPGLKPTPVITPPTAPEPVSAPITPEPTTNPSPTPIPTPIPVTTPPSTGYTNYYPVTPAPVSHFWLVNIFKAVISWLRRKK